MRSHQIHRVLAHGYSRYEVCQLVGKDVRAVHRSDSRFEDSINNVLQFLGTHDTPTHSAHPADGHGGPTVP